MEHYRRSSIICDISPALWPWGLSMPDQRFLALAQEARDRAEEILAKAENYKDAGAKQKMLEVAAKYQELAERMEKVAADDP
jgi:hypothetical protein